jgi:hypothetical protein
MLSSQYFPVLKVNFWTKRTPHTKFFLRQIVFKKMFLCGESFWSKNDGQEFELCGTSKKALLGAKFKYFKFETIVTAQETFEHSQCDIIY